jgi:hypothetical protein
MVDCGRDNDANVNFLPVAGAVTDDHWWTLGDGKKMV